MQLPSRTTRLFLHVLLSAGAVAAQNPQPYQDPAASGQYPNPPASSQQGYQDPPGFNPAQPSFNPAQPTFSPAQNPPFAVVNPNGPSPAMGPGPRYSLDATRQDVSAVLGALARKSGVPMSILEMPVQLVTVSFRNLSFEKALAQILAAGGLDYRKVDEGYVVGQSMDLRLKYPQPGEAELDATYRCRRVGATTVAQALNAILPGVKAVAGPLFLSPELKEASYGDTQGSQIRTLVATDPAQRTHDVVISGPADLVRRALTLAQKFDRPRKMVRLSVKVITINENAKKDLGVDWMNTITASAAERPNVDSVGNPIKDSTSTSGGGLVDGIRMGKFAHSPLVISATINALEQKGLAKTLSNPTLLILDGERSFILDGQKFSYPDFRTKDNNGQALFSVAEMKIGVYLQVGVQVGLDNDMVLSLYPQVTALAGTTLINGAQVPNVFTSEVQTTVKATSGEVLVLGGLTKETSSSTRNGIPFLARIPLLGYLFSNTVKDSTKSELMIILTPELVDEAPPREAVNLTVTEGPAQEPAAALAQPGVDAK